MKLLVATDAHIYAMSDGTYWTDKIYGYNFWKRYLNVFEEVRVLARTKTVSNFSEKWMRVDGPNVEVFGITFYQGPKELAKKYNIIQRELKTAFQNCSAAIFRMPSQTAYMAFRHMPTNFPCAGEIVYDPTDDLKSMSDGFMMYVLNTIISKQLKKFCWHANGVSYVTRETIQKNYPSRARMNGESNRYFETYYSTITLDDEAFFKPRKFDEKKTLTLALSDVSMNTERKGERTLIKVVEYAVKKGYDINAVIIGDGTKKQEFMELVDELKLGGHIRFTGLLPSADEVRKELLKADIFMFPSKGEGLPRGILEAMASGMPVLSSPVGGIPEIIDREYLYDPTDINGYGEKICELINNPQQLNKMSIENYEKAREFKNEILQDRRDKFYEKLKQIIK